MNNRKRITVTYHWKKEQINVAFLRPNQSSPFKLSATAQTMPLKSFGE
ncbi:MAG: hypothetical protein AAF960_09175 [Bacteroidota bacterium]